MEYARIKDGKVRNIIVLDDESLHELFLEGYDHLIRVDYMPQRPNIGDLYVDSNFINPANDLNNITNLDLIGLNYFQHTQVRDKIKAIVISKAQSGVVLTDGEKLIAAKWILLPYANRLALVGDDNDKANWKTLIEETKGIKKEDLKGRIRIVEEMRQFVSDSLRTESNSKTNIDNFQASTQDYLKIYIESNGVEFWDWLNNTAGTSFENNGFAQKVYFNASLKDGLNSIMNGNY